MNAEFNWWLLIVGVVGGAGLLWLILGDWSRREEEVGDAERARESAWIADALRNEGRSIAPETAEEVLRLHRVWLRETGGFEPADDPLEAPPLEAPPLEFAHGRPEPVAGDQPPNEPADVRSSAGRAIRGESLPEE